MEMPRGPEGHRGNRNPKFEADFAQIRGDCKVTWIIARRKPAARPGTAFPCILAENFPARGLVLKLAF
jgi:hypothetical protein